MLNITTRISLSHRSKRAIKRLKKVHFKTGFKVGAWGQIASSVKNEVSKKLLLNQRFRCAYCERYLLNTGHEIDHFAHKALYPQFSFHPTNLFYACKSCNSSARKGQKPTIVGVPHKYYNSCTFSIVHPFFDDPDAEIKYSDPDKVYFDWGNCTQKGKDTIDFFKFKDFQTTMVRSRTLIMERYAPFTTEEEMKLIREAVAYK